MQPVVGAEHEGQRLIAKLGRGGMADVYLAVRTGVVGFHKLVVIKRLRSDLADQPQAAKYRSLLLDEARLAARLHHPNIVQTFEVGDDQVMPYLAMEYLDGQPVSRVLMQARRLERKLPVELALQIVIDVLSGLAYAHDLADFDGTPLHIVHRDLSPQNMFWTYDGDLKLVDFGVAKYALTSQETEAGVVKGKLTYMAPEQARGLPVDRRADLFVVGIVLWELLAGRRLLRAPSQAAALQRLLFEELPSLARVVPAIDPAIVRICDRALSRELRTRYATAGEMKADLEQVLGDRAPRRADLVAFIQPLFVEERAAMAAHLREALAGQASRDSELVTLSPPDLMSSKEITISAPTVIGRPRTDPAAPAEAAPSITTMPIAQAPSRRRMWLAGLGLAALAVVGADILLWRQPGDAPPPAPASRVAASTVAVPTDPAPAPARVPDLRLCGSNTIGAELAPALVEAFLRRKGAASVARVIEPEHAKLTARIGASDLIVDIRAAGSATAFDGLVAASCDLGMASRAINAKELAAIEHAGYGDLASPATEHVIGLDGIAVIVHPNNPLASLDRGQLHDLFTGKITDWGALGGTPGPIKLLARDARSGTFDTFKNLVLGADPLAPSARRLAESDVLADGVASDPSAIGFIGLAYVRSAKALAVGDPGAPPRLPTSFTVTTEQYMLSRRLYMYSTPRPRTPLVAELISFVLSTPGQAVVRDTNFIDLSVALRDGEPCDARCPRTYAAAIAHAQRLSLDFRFRSGAEVMDSRATRDLDRVVQLLRTTPNAKLLLLGFSDSAGAPAANAALSRRRATAIAKELELRGIHPGYVEGFGAAMPVASNATEADRQRNRRVEAWLDVGR